MTDDVRALLPRTKSDLTRAHAVVARGYPAVAPILPELLAWVRDYNWPVAKVLAPFLATVGLPLVPAIRDVLRSDDGVWKAWVLSLVVVEAPAVADALRAELTRLAAAPTPDDAAEEVHLVARDILRMLDRREG